MTIQQFQYVLAVAEKKHFEQAAEKCFITQSTLSTMIAKLESEIGIKIFDRKTKPVTITVEGEELIAKIKIILREIDSLTYAVQEMKGDMGGELTIGVIPTIAPYLLPLFLAKFAQVFPKLKITTQEMRSSAILESLKNRSLDIGIAAIPLKDKELVEVELYKEPFYLFDCFLKKSNPVISAKEIDFSQLFLLEEGHCLRTQVEQICNLSKRKNQMNFEFRAGSIDSLIRFTKAQRGITLLPKMATCDLSEEDKLCLRKIDIPVPFRSVGLVVHQYFVKKIVLDKLKNIIQKEVHKFISKIDRGELVEPFS